MFYNMDCIEGAKLYLPDNSIDLIVTDPPYGIAGETLHKHYNRKEETVLGGYIDVKSSDYAEFSKRWIREAARVLRPGGSLYIISGYTHLFEILLALRETSLKEVNHLIWKYNFGVYTKKKFVSSHYHILYYVKPGSEPTFNTYCRFGDSEKNEENGSLNYLDREDVWYINKAYKPGEVKNKNQLPEALLIKIIQYSSRPNDMVCDFFLGSFSTAKVAIGLGRRACGFEKSSIAFDFQINEMKKIIPNSLTDQVKQPAANQLINQGKSIHVEEIAMILENYQTLLQSGATKKNALETLSRNTGRGYFSLKNIIAKYSPPSP